TRDVATFVTVSSRARIGGSIGERVTKVATSPLTTSPRRILIAGAGALGSMYGGFLRRAGHSVTLLGRPEHIDAIRRRGLAIEGIFGEHQVEGFELASAPEEVRGQFELVILAVKSYDVERTARPFAGALAPEGQLLALQNGLGHLEILAEIFGAERLLGAPVLIGASIPEPGRVRVTVYVKPVKVGAPWPREGDDSAGRFARTLAAAGIPSEATDRLLPFLWEKVLYNAPLNALGALLGVPYGALAERPESRRIMDDVVGEGHAVASASGVALLWRTAAEARRHFYEVLLPPTVAHRSSMLQDIERGKRTEVDANNGYICRRGAELGVATPVNAVLTDLIHATEEARKR
ncbi:MAG: ketopantoate reductase family protein, partial [Candidatus Binatia bacterium]